MILCGCRTTIRGFDPCTSDSQRCNAITEMPNIAPLNVILAVDPITPTLTGIGRYTFELATGLSNVATDADSAAAINSIRYFWHWKFVESIDPLLAPNVAANIASSPDSLIHQWLRAAYEVVTPALQTYALKGFATSLYHSPNFYLPERSGPSVTTFHDLSVSRFPEWHPKARITHLAKALPQALARADAIITPTACVRAELIASDQVDTEKIFVVPMGVSTAWFVAPRDADAAALSAIGLVANEYALCVATLEPRKNLIRLLRSYGSLAPSERKRWPLVLCGRLGWSSDNIQTEVALGVQSGWLKYLGFVPDELIQVLMRQARCFVFPSLYEGFGLPVLEAMASGVPVVASDIPSLREVAGSAALFPDPLSEYEIRVSIQRALVDEAWRQTVKASGRLRASEFSWARTVSETVAVYAHVLTQQ